MEGGVGLIVSIVNLADRNFLPFANQSQALPPP
jgi:hypothetical protein